MVATGPGTNKRLSVPIILILKVSVPSNLLSSTVVTVMQLIPSIGSVVPEGIVIFSGKEKSSCSVTQKAETLSSAHVIRFNRARMVKVSCKTGCMLYG